MEYGYLQLHKQLLIHLLAGIQIAGNATKNNEKYNPSFKLTYDIAKVLEAPIETLFWFEE